MIDTVCLQIPKSQLTDLDLTSHGVFLRDLQHNKFIRNPSKSELDSGLYYPRLTGYGSKFFLQEPNVRIEFSAPKLLYLNNLDELEDKDFLDVVAVLQERLTKMGMAVSRDVLEHASVSSVHFSKNVLVEDGYTSSYLISEMGKVDLKKSFDISRCRYMNDGQSLSAHMTTHQLIIYDKIADLRKGRKRAIDKDPTLYQQALLTKFMQLDELPEIIRFEVRLSRKPKMNSVLEGLNYTNNPTFSDVFSSGVSTGVVSSYWDKLIMEKNRGLFSLSSGPKSELKQLLLADKELKPKQAVYLVGLHQLAKDEEGVRQLRSIVTKNAHDRTWYRMSRDIRHAGELITHNKVRDWVKQIDKKIKNYEPYKTEKYEVGR